MATRAEWIERVQRCERSGLDLAEYGRPEGIKPKQLYWWRWRLRSSGEPASAVAPEFLPVRVVTSTRPNPGHADRNRAAQRPDRARRARLRPRDARARAGDRLRAGARVLTLPPSVHVYVAAEPAGMRRSFDARATMASRCLSRTLTAGAWGETARAVRSSASSARRG